MYIYDFVIRDCWKNSFHIFKKRRIFDIKVTKTANNELFKLKKSNKEMILYGLDKKLKIARENGLIFNLIKKLKRKIYSSVSRRYLSYYLKKRKPIM